MFLLRHAALLIATYALSHDVPLLAGDRDFAAMARAGVKLAVVG